MENRYFFFSFVQLVTIINFILGFIKSFHFMWSVKIVHCCQKIDLRFFSSNFLWVFFDWFVFFSLLFFFVSVCTRSLFQPLSRLQGRISLLLFPSLSTLRAKATFHSASFFSFCLSSMFRSSFLSSIRMFFVYLLYFFLSFLICTYSSYFWLTICLFSSQCLIIFPRFSFRAICFFPFFFFSPALSVFLYTSSPPPPLSLSLSLSWFIFSVLHISLAFFRSHQFILQYSLFVSQYFSLTLWVSVTLFSFSFLSCFFSILFHCLYFSFYISLPTSLSLSDWFAQ